MLHDEAAVAAEAVVTACLSHLAELIADARDEDAYSEAVRDQAEHAALCTLLRLAYRRRGSRGVRVLQETMDLPDLAA